MPVIVGVSRAARGVLHARELDAVKLHVTLRTFRPDTGDGVLCESLSAGLARAPHCRFKCGRNPRVCGRCKAQCFAHAEDGFLIQRGAVIDHLAGHLIDVFAVSNHAANFVGFGVAVLHPCPELLGCQGAHFDAATGHDAMLDNPVFTLPVVVVKVGCVTFEQVRLSGRGAAAKRFEAALAHCRLLPGGHVAKAT